MLEPAAFQAAGSTGFDHQGGGATYYLLLTTYYLLLTADYFYLLQVVERAAAIESGVHEIVNIFSGLGKAR